MTTQITNQDPLDTIYGTKEPEETVKDIINSDDIPDYLLNKKEINAVNQLAGDPSQLKETEQSANITSPSCGEHPINLLAESQLEKQLEQTWKQEYDTKWESAANQQKEPQITPSNSEPEESPSTSQDNQESANDSTPETDSKEDERIAITGPVLIQMLGPIHTALVQILAKRTLDISKADFNNDNNFIRAATRVVEPLKLINELELFRSNMEYNSQRIEQIKAAKDAMEAADKPQIIVPDKSILS